jgi:HAE1 family hydrophobic/amphiphilic exporter-1
VTRTLAGLSSAVPIGSVDVEDVATPVYLQPVQVPATLDQLRAVVLPTPTGAVPLASLATVEEVEVPSSVSRIDGERAATVSATPADADLGTLTAALRTAIDELDLTAGVDVSVGGVAADQSEAFADLGLALLIAVVIVYLVMVATFRSLAQVIGGLISSTVLTLLLVPVLYTSLERRREARAEKRHARTPGPTREPVAV